MANRAGAFVTNLSGELAYESFKPSPLPPNPQINIQGELLDKLIDANKKVAMLESLSRRIPDMNLFISMYVRKEALLSSQIEGTQCTLDDILNPLSAKSVNQDISEVVNYINATEFAINRLKTLPLCNRLIKETHRILLEGRRGQEKTPGEFRYTQNWIGGQGSTIKNARYIPPNPDDMVNAISDLEKYINSKDNLDSLIQAALIHYQFETIHPFLDGNGRIGRLLITLFLIEKKVLTTPALYISCFLKMNQIEYYDRMTEVRRSGNYEQWVMFFLDAISISAEDALSTIDALAELHDRNTMLINGLSTRQRDTAMRLFAYIEANPIIEIDKTAKALGLSYNTIASYIDILTRKDILKQTGKIGKMRIFSYYEYLGIIRKDT